MIQKIKDLMHIKEEIDSINTSLRDTKDSMESFKEEFKSTKNELAEIKKQQSEFLKNFKENLNLIDESKKHLSDSVYDFNLLKNKLSNQILERFEEELKNELKINLEGLKLENDKHKVLQAEIQAVASSTRKAASEIDKFIGISQEIKKGDFELTNHAKNLKEADSEKLELMKRIDYLERIISRMKRNRN